MKEKKIHMAHIETEEYPSKVDCNRIKRKETERESELNRKKKKKKENSIPVHTIKAAIEVNKNKREKIYIHRRSDDNNNSIAKSHCKTLAHNKTKKKHIHENSYSSSSFFSLLLLLCVRSRKKMERKYQHMCISKDIIILVRMYECTVLQLARGIYDICRRGRKYIKID